MSGKADTGPAWIGVDWGTTHLRAWAMDAAGRVLHDDASDRGMGTLSRDQYEETLLDLVGGWLGTGTVPVVVCGMAGSRQGWAEAAYAAVPCPPLGAPLTRVQTADRRIAVSIIPGLKQERPADVMRGEETQIAGFLHLNPRFDGVVCLPGTHTKWAHVSAGEVVSFQTAMTGDLFAALAHHSVLRHSLADEGWDGEAFATALAEAQSRPEALAARLFALRAEGLLHGLSPSAARARLSGLLIGAELAATKPYWLGREVALIGASTLCAHYETALRAQGLAPIRTNGDAMTRAGLLAARAQIKEPTP
ncbi:2-dehydro-3-deoxygalactonokinase [Oceaniglobus roseus]|uniref:2-dehydro-3-deoxygalactonokinase n=1 Tax=Oceaniglobus roseus TaxID=1737570 RepID=UPI000C7F5386|nr:2-dehydro-3-deoxygalactonokinase [Kandeliimicrobium roseum]